MHFLGLFSSPRAKNLFLPSFCPRPTPEPAVDGQFLFNLFFASLGSIWANGKLLFSTIKPHSLPVGVTGLGKSVQGGWDWGGWPTGNEKKVSSSQAQLGQATCLAVIYFLSISCGEIHPIRPVQSWLLSGYSDALWNLNFSRTVAGITKWFWVTIEDILATSCQNLKT